MSQDLKWMFNIESVFKKTQQRMYFLSQLRKFNLPQELLVKFYSAIIQSGLSLQRISTQDRQLEMLRQSLVQTTGGHCPSSPQ